jgi:hypothetical protein
MSLREYRGKATASILGTSHIPACVVRSVDGIERVLGAAAGLASHGHIADGTADVRVVTMRNRLDINRRPGHSRLAPSGLTTRPNDGDYQRHRTFIPILLELI